jgi:hypothetical protein
MASTAPQTLPLDVALQQAVTHHQAGRLQEAEQLYRAILQAQTQHAKANHNLDMAIYVDTSVAHLVGAVGEPVWLLNRYNTYWRWLTEREDSRGKQ